MLDGYNGSYYKAFRTEHLLHSTVKCQGYFLSYNNHAICNTVIVSRVLSHFGMRWEQSPLYLYTILLLELCNLFHSLCLGRKCILLQHNHQYRNRDH